MLMEFDVNWNFNWNQKLFDYDYKFEMSAGTVQSNK
jgi:hypothetical protein